MVPRLLEDETQHVSDVRVVVDDEDVPLGSGHVLVIDRPGPRLEEAPTATFVAETQVAAGAEC